MKRVTRNKLLRLVELKKQDLEDRSNIGILKIINEFVEINMRVDFSPLFLIGKIRRA